jgi:cytochrome c oxidase accessory protein FixG
MLFFTAATYINAGWMREQVCKYMCPYARFQSAMFDQDTLIVSYDVKRGESRGSRKKNADPATLGLGDCVDCSVCVQVCPTGIDIRDGLQYECITCAHCIDACDEVMDKMDYPRGLIRYTTQHELEGGKTKFLRPRLIGYGIVMLIMVFAFGYKVATRIPLELDIIRDRNQLFGYSSTGNISNTYSLKIMNMDQKQHSYRLGIKGDDQLQYIGKKEITVASGEHLTLPVQLEINPAKINRSNIKVHFRVEAIDDRTIQAQEETRFLGPTPMPD